MSKKTNLTGLEIAIIGMAGRFPGAKNIGEFWENLIAGKESISFFTDEELIEAGVDPKTVANPNYVKANGILEDIDLFDSSFFGYTEAEARLMDPQTRIFHECAWESLDDSGYCPDTYTGLIGLYVGASPHFDWEALALFSDEIDRLGVDAAQLLMNKDFIGGWVSYRLNLKGPAITLTTACSTSLVAIHLACQGILNGECDMALAGGISVTYLSKSGYTYHKGIPFSPDGHVRAFDAGPHGIVGGNGAAVVVLKPLEDAVNDRDHIYALIKGSAINSDGVNKVGFTAPSVEGQARAIRAALDMAEVDPETIGYVETHGTATELGDPVEIQALKLAFNTIKRQYCRIGSVKTNIGHLDAAAGAAGLIKSALCLKYGIIPASLNFKRPNPNIDFENTPFYVNAELSEWKDGNCPLRAGVSSFGLGGTNAHVILEEAPPEETSSQSRPFQLLLLSSKTSDALDRNTQNLALHLEKNPAINLANAAYTLQTGRKALQYRRMLVCENREQAVRYLSLPEHQNLQTRFVSQVKRQIVFVFSGQGSQYVNMGIDLYNQEAQFREDMERGFHILESLCGVNIKDILYPLGKRLSDSKEKIAQYGGPITLLFEYSLAKLLMNWGLIPQALIGYSFGEYTAACLAGVFSLEDALELTVRRGRMMLDMPVGSMMSVPLPEDELKHLLSGDIDIAAVNGPAFCIVSGPPDPIKRLRNDLRTRGIECYRFKLFRAGHSKMMAPFKEEFISHFEGIQLDTPKIPYISGLTGKWITRQQATSPGYWARHMTETIRFADGVNALIKKSNPVFIQPGADRGIPLYVNQNPLKKEENIIVNIVRHPNEESHDVFYLLNSLGQLWLSGVNIDWEGFYNSEKRNRVPLPAYSFEPIRYPFMGNIQEIAGRFLSEKPLQTRKKYLADWFYIPLWEQSFPSKEYAPASLSHYTWLVFSLGNEPGKKIVDRLRGVAEMVIIVKPGETFEKINEREFTVNLRSPGDYDALVAELSKNQRIPQRVLHLWAHDAYDPAGTNHGSLDLIQELGLYSVLNMVKAFGNHFITTDIRMDIVTCCMQEVTGEDELFPVQATILGAVKIIPLEYVNIFCRSIDKEIDTPVDLLIRELCIDSPDIVVALRGNHRWLQNMKAVQLEEVGAPGPFLKEKGVYLITGGLGGIGFTIAERLAKQYKARIILIDIYWFPPRELWNVGIPDNEDRERIDRKLRSIQNLEKEGAEFLIYNADISDYEAVKQVVDEVTERFGVINGVIHTAGLLDFEGVIQNRTREMTEKLLAAKVRGVLILDEILKDKPVDFWVFSSSVGNIIYGVKFGQVGYNAGHEFLDVFARYKQKHGVRAVTIDWPDWLEVGMIEEMIKRNKGKQYTPPGIYDILAITPSEGVEIFLRILHSMLTQVTVSPNDLHALMKYFNKSKSTRDIPAAIHENELSSTVQKTQAQKRPRLSTEYAEPRDEQERKAVEIFQKFFGIEQIGIYDDFYELGGDSLKAVQLASMMKKSDLNIHFHQLLLLRNIDEICRNLSQKGKLGMDMEAIELYLSRKYNATAYFRNYTVGGLPCRILFIAAESFEITVVLEDIKKKADSETVIYPDFVTFIAPGALPPDDDDVNDELLTNILGLKDSISEHEWNEIFKELDNNDGFTHLLKKNKKNREYEVSPVQSSNLKPPYTTISRNNAPYSFDFCYPADFEKIRDIVIVLAQQNSLLRSVIVLRNGNHFIEEFDSFSNIHLPLVDISFYSETCKTELLDGILKRLCGPFEVTDNVLFRAAVLKMNHSHYRFLFVPNHLISDAVSVGIAEKQISRLSQGIKEDQENAYSVKDYYDYVQFLKTVDYKSIQLDKYLDLHVYSHFVTEIRKKFKVGNLEHEAFELDLATLNEKNRAYYNEIMLLGYAAVIGDLFGVDKAPIISFSAGRSYKGGDFNHIIGDFHDTIPVCVSLEGDRQVALEHFIDYMRFIRENNLNFYNYVGKGCVEGFDFAKLASPFTFNSITGTYDLFKKGRDEGAEKMAKTLNMSYPYFFMGVLENFSAGKLWITFLQNSGRAVKDILMKNYSALADFLNKKN